jgi:hypothetical protein
MKDRIKIAVSVPPSTSREEIDRIRCQYKEKYGDCIVNILVCGQESFKENLYNFIKARIKS